MPSSRFWLALGLASLLWSCSAFGGVGKQQRVAPMMPLGGGAIINMPTADLLATNPALYYETAVRQGKTVDMNELVASFKNLLLSDTAKKSTVQALSYVQSLATLGVLTEADVQQAYALFIRQIARDRSPGVALAMLGSNILPPQQTQALVDEIKPMVGSPISNGDKNNKKEWFKSVVTVHVLAGYAQYYGISMPRMVSGTGFFIDKKGYIVTNWHVIQPYLEAVKSRVYADLRVEVSGKEDDEWIKAKVIGYDATVDLALLKVEDYQPEGVIALSESASLRVGDTVYAMGSPAGLSETLTSGIVSNLSRRGNVGKLIQIDAPLNFGNSGGPLVNAQGDLLGVNVSILDHGMFEGLNFAISVETLRLLLPKLVVSNGDEARLPYLGVGINETEQGLDLSLITQDSLLDKTGIKDGSHLSWLAGKNVDGMKALQVQDILLKQMPNSLVKLTVVGKDGKAKEVLTRVQVRPRNPALLAASTTASYRLYGPMFGMIVEPISANMMIVSKVYGGNDSAAAQLGIKKKDTLTVMQSFFFDIPRNGEARSDGIADIFVLLFRVVLSNSNGQPRVFPVTSEVNSWNWL